MDGAGHTQDLCTSHAALTTPDRPFAELLWTAQAEYPLPPRRPSGDRFSANCALWLPYLRLTESGWAMESAGWIAAADGSVRPSRPGSDDSPYEPTALGAGVLLVRPGAFLDDPALLPPDLLVRNDYSLAHPPRHNDGSTRPPYVHIHRGHSDRVNHFCGHSLRILGESLSMRAELGWRRKRILTPYVHRAKCRDFVSAILERLLARTRAGTRTLFAKVRAHNSCELNAAADRLAAQGATLPTDQGAFAESTRDFSLQCAKWDPASQFTTSTADARTAGLLAFPSAAPRKTWSKKNTWLFLR